MSNDRIPEIENDQMTLTSWPISFTGIAEQEDDGEPFDAKMKRLTSELSILFTENHRLEAEIKKQ